MSRPVPTAIAVGIRDASFTDTVRCSIDFELDGMRGHVWARFPIGEPERLVVGDDGWASQPNVIYFNPLQPLRPSEPGYFATRTCRQGSRRGQAIIAAVLPVARTLAAKAFEDYRAEQAAQAARLLASRKRMAVLQAIDAELDSVLAALELCPAGRVLLARIGAARDAVA